ncbi:MAG: hypothetical protein MJ192_10885 [Clostridia bacterium]|nr:hypothetical protein [Clostridia bacterium]
MTFLGIDAGTTCTKGVLFSESGEILTTESRDNALIEKNGETYIDLPLIWDNVQSILTAVSRDYQIGTVAFTSLGESFAALDENDDLLFPPMLYSDPRGTEQAERLSRELGDDSIFALTGVVPQGMYSICKLLWWRENRPEVYAKIRKVFLVGDYLGYCLTGNAMIDRGLASRTGALDIKNMIFDAGMLATAGLTPDMFSEVVPAGTVIGTIRPELAEQLGMDPGCLVVAGSHDQICSALGSGGIRDGVGVDGMGTVECIVALFRGQVTDAGMGREGYVCAPFAADGTYATYMFNYTCGGLMKWFKSTLCRDLYPEGEDSFYAWCEKDIDTAHASGLLLLPYFRGAATPYNDIFAKGAMIGLTCDTTPQDVYRAVLEATSYEMRVNLEAMSAFGMRLDELIVTGGCARSDAWLQIKANILGIPVRRVSNVEAGCCGTAMLGAVAAGVFPDLDAAAGVFVTPGKVFYPQKDESFEKQYEKYKKLYKTVKEFF